MKIGSTFSTLEKMKIRNFLREKWYIFAWKHKDMLGIDRRVIQYRLNVNQKCRLVQQRQRIFALKCNNAVAKEVEKFLKAGFIREVFYLEWLANIVLVKKNNGK